MRRQSLKQLPGNVRECRTCWDSAKVHDLEERVYDTKCRWKDRTVHPGDCCPWHYYTDAAKEQKLC